jgi:hypothetical protein
MIKKRINIGFNPKEFTQIKKQANIFNVLPTTYCRGVILKNLEAGQVGGLDSIAGFKQMDLFKKNQKGKMKND